MAVQGQLVDTAALWGLRAGAAQTREVPPLGVGQSVHTEETGEVLELVVGAGLVPLLQLLLVSLGPLEQDLEPWGGLSDCDVPPVPLK
jgi:hypothetical protein